MEAFHRATALLTDTQTRSHRFDQETTVIKID
jgi:hypothetical protein